MVRDQEHRAALALELRQAIDDHRAVLVVEVARRLVAQQQLRTVQHGAGQGHALLLACAQGRRHVVPPGREAEAGDQFLGPLRKPSIARPSVGARMFSSTLK